MQSSGIWPATDADFGVVAGCRGMPSLTLATGGFIALGFGGFAPPGSIKLLSISQSMAFLDAYCFASFFLVKETASPNGPGLSAKIAVHMNLDGAGPITLSIYFRPSVGGLTLRYSSLVSVWSTTLAQRLTKKLANPISLSNLL